MKIRQIGLVGTNLQENLKINRYKMPHVFEPLFAEKYSMNGAVLIQEIDFWLSVNKANGVNFVDGKYWTYFTADKYCNSHRYFTPTKFHSAIQGLLAEKVIEVGCFNENKFNRTK